MREVTRQESSRTHPRESSFMSLLSGWAQQGVQSYFATQRLLLELAMRQNASMMHVLQERLCHQTDILTELADDGMSNLVKAHQVLLDLAQQNNEIVMTGVKERVSSSTTAVAMTDLLRRSFDTVIDLQHQFLKIADKQSHTWMQAAKTGKAPKGDTLVDFAREAMDTFVHAEKKFLDVVAEETAKATSAKHTNGAAKKMKRTELAGLARRATESFIDAQKKLWDVAGSQMNLNLKAAGRTIDVMTPVAVMPFSDLTRKGVKSFVDAQKALMDVMTKPHSGAKPAAKARRTKKPVRAAKIETGHAAHAAV